MSRPSTLTLSPPPSCAFDGPPPPPVPHRPAGHQAPPPQVRHRRAEPDGARTRHRQIGHQPHDHEIDQPSATARTLLRGPSAQVVPLAEGSEESVGSPLHQDPTSTDLATTSRQALLGGTTTARARTIPSPTALQQDQTSTDPEATSRSGTTSGARGEGQDQDEERPLHETAWAAALGVPQDDVPAAEGRGDAGVALLGPPSAGSHGEGVLLGSRAGDGEVGGGQESLVRRWGDDPAISLLGRAHALPPLKPPRRSNGAGFGDGEA